MFLISQELYAKAAMERVANIFKGIFNVFFFHKMFRCTFYSDSFYLFAHGTFLPLTYNIHKAYSCCNHQHSNIANRGVPYFLSLFLLIRKANLKERFMILYIFYIPTYCHSKLSSLDKHLNHICAFTAGCLSSLPFSIFFFVPFYHFKSHLQL